MGRYILYMLLICMITMLLVWKGVQKERRLTVELTTRLYKKCAKKILRYLKKHPFATRREIQNQIMGITASVFWSKNKITITNPVQFSDIVLNGLYEEGKINIEVKKNKRVYVLKYTQPSA